MKILTIVISIVALTVTACSTSETKDQLHDHSSTAKEKYTCPMHPSVVQDKPGQCPVCGMDLVLQVAATGSSSDLMLTDTQLKLANVTTQLVKERSIGQTIPVNARLMANEELTEIISTRTAGRIERLFIKETGKPVRQGEALYELYSETLLTLQQEYLLAKTQFEKLGDKEPRYVSLLKSAEKKLLLYGLSQAQINRLSDQGQASSTIVFLSPASGIVREINAAEGQYVNEGTVLYQIENTRQLWVEAELYPEETRFVKRGDNIKIQVNGYEGQLHDATVIFLNPEFRANTQITTIRASLNNADMQWKPGQLAQVFLQHSAKHALSIPVDAVIRDERGTHVYVQTEKNTFAPRSVKTGVENFTDVEITEGLKAGETIAVTGAYLLYSEIILKKGIDPMAGSAQTHAH